MYEYTANRKYKASRPKKGKIDETLAVTLSLSLSLSPQQMESMSDLL